MHIPLQLFVHPPDMAFSQGVTIVFFDEAHLLFNHAPNALQEKIEQLEQTLPPGVTIDPFYDRTDLVRRTIRTVAKNLTEGGLLVIAVLLLLLGSLRGGLIVSSNTWTFCEMKDNENGAGMQGLETLNLVGDYALWLFGGCGGDALQFSCKDECPQ